jgi:hypothetical protein
VKIIIKTIRPADAGLYRSTVIGGERRASKRTLPSLPSDRNGADGEASA